MSSQLHRVMVIGAALGVSSQMASLFPEPKPTKQRTEADMRKIALAQNKRLKREARNRRLTP